MRSRRRPTAGVYPGGFRRILGDSGGILQQEFLFGNKTRLPKSLLRQIPPLGPLDVKAVHPLEHGGQGGRRNSVIRSDSGICRSRGWNPGRKSRKKMSGESHVGCILIRSLHSIRHFRKRRRIRWSISLSRFSRKSRFGGGCGVRCPCR